MRPATQRGRAPLLRRAAPGMGLLTVVALLAAGCGASGAGASSPTATPPPAPTATATRTAAEVCASLNGDPITLTIPLPPGTLSKNIGGGAAGATYYFECTQGMSQAALVASLNTVYQQAGWTKWNPAVDDAGGCGSQANDFWQWKNSTVTVGWTFRNMSLPEWTIAVCSLAYATPQA